MLYIYNTHDTPDLDMIHDLVASGVLQNKQISYCRWDQTNNLLKIEWYNDLKAQDKLLLDDIVEQSQNMI